MSQPSRVRSLAAAREDLSSDAFYPEPSAQFVSTPRIEGICERALAYLEAGYPLHLSGPSGIGKTTLAFHIAAQLEQPAVLLHGNHEHGTSDLVGSNVGYRRSKVVDNYIHSVLKTSEEMREMWVDNRLAQACRRGYTMIYDEFNRTRPEANNILLSVLEEKLLSLPGKSGAGYVRVHENFRAIFTSNPAEYAGTHATQDALMDRLITIRLTAPDRQTELAVVRRRSGIDAQGAATIVDLVRDVRALDPLGTSPSVRVGVAIARVMVGRGTPIETDSTFFRAVCEDMFLSRGAPDASMDEAQFAERVARALDERC